MVLILRSSVINFSGGDRHWSGTFSENSLFIVLEIKGTVDKQAIKTGKEILDKILTEFTDHETKDAELLRELLKIASKSEQICSLTIGVLSGSDLYLGSKGFSEVLIKRNGKVGQILTSDDFKKGSILNGDLILISSQKFNILVDKQKRLDLINENDFLEATEKGIEEVLKNEDKEGAAGLFIKFTERAEKPVPRVLLPDKIKRYVDRLFQRKEEREEPLEETKSKRKLLFIALVLILFLIGSVFLNLSKHSSEAKRKKLKEVLDLVSHQYEEAQSLIDLNPVRARSLLSDSKLSLGSLVSEFPPKSNEAKEVNGWLGKISEEEVIAYKIYKLTSVPLYFDINFIKQNGVGNKISAYKEKKAILDTVNKVVYSLSSDTKQAAIVAGEDVVKDAQTITVHGNNIFVLNSDGVVMIDAPSKSSKIIIKTDEKWGVISALDSFGGNLYLLDSKNSRIFKYIATDTGFSDRTSYLNSDVRVDLTSSTKMEIDGSVWVLNSGSEILKFSRGLSEIFAFKNFSENFHDVPSFSTTESDKYLYILDKSLGRIVVFDKEGTYDSQYQWDEIKNAIDLVASEEEKKIFVLIGSKIYAVDIR